MGSTVKSSVQRISQDRDATVSVRWRSWPLGEQARWSWLVLAGILSIGGVVGYFGESWLLGAVAAAGLATTLWQFFVPVDYEIGAVGLRRTAFGRTRMVPWHAVRAYQLRPTGVVLYQRHDPARIDLLRSIFMPYPVDPSEALSTLRPYLSHAVELPE